MARCERSCADGQVCAHLREGEQFLRISVQSGDQVGSTRVVLWRGQREEIYQDGKIPPTIIAISLLRGLLGVKWTLPDGNRGCQFSLFGSRALHQS
jgi:hypothetical protein